MLGLMLNVFIEVGILAEVAQMPVEGSVVLPSSGGDGGHDHVAAVPGIAGDREVPGALAIRPCLRWCGGLRERGAGECTENQYRPQWRQVPDWPLHRASRCVRANCDASRAHHSLARFWWMAIPKMFIPDAEFIWECAHIRLHF